MKYIDGHVIHWLICFLTLLTRPTLGAGAPVPYRIYVDSGVVMLCLFALAPASPLIAPAAMLYFFFCTPLLRWTMIFLYKPKFDIGGQRFPFICDICISGMVVGQILLTTMMALKGASGPAALAGLPIFATIWYRNTLRRRHLRAYKDVALLQTSLLVCLLCFDYVLISQTCRVSPHSFFL